MPSETDLFKSKYLLKGKQFLHVDVTSVHVLFLCHVLLAPLVSPDIF